MAEVTLRGVEEVEVEQKEMRRADLGKDRVIEVPKKELPIIEEPEPITKEEASSKLNEHTPILRKAARYGVSIRMWTGRLKKLGVKKLQPYIEPLTTTYSDTQRKFTHKGVQVTLTDRIEQSMEPEDLINLVGIETTLALGLLSVNMTKVRAAVTTEMINIEEIEPFINKKKETSMSIRLVPQRKRKKPKAKKW